MTQTLTQLIASTQAQLLDDGTRFTTATVTAAVRAALKDFNLSAPVNAADIIDAVSDQHDYEIADARALSITDVLKYDDDGDEHEPVVFDDYSEDERLFFRLRSAMASGEYILARFTIPHTVSELDAEVESTISNLWDQVLIDGACYYACTYRSVSLAESNNLNSGANNGMAKAAEHFKTAFMLGLAKAAKKRPAVSEPDRRAWNDQWYGMSV